ncbi:hypothetical protein B566_EDAN004828 [Ephemera danica]|nr:hypothetical protein B566_EDAN004828 [Ephemera danica]
MRSWVTRLVVLTAFLFCNVQAQQRELTHDDLATAIVALAKDIRDNSARLERHEQRERQLGEHLKRVIANVEKRLKTQETELTGVQNTLNQILSSLQQRDERERIQLQRVFEAVDNVRTTVETRSVGSVGGGSGGSNDVELRALRQQLEQLTQQATPGTDLVLASEKLRDAAANLVLGETRWRQHGEESARLVSELRSALEKLLVKGGDEDVAPHLGAILDSLEATQRILTDTTSNLERDLRGIVTAMDTSNTTLKAIAQLREDTLHASQRVIVEVNNAKQDTSRGQAILNDALALVRTDSTKTLEAVRGVEKVIVQTADAVLDTKRRVDFGVQKVIFENSETVKSQAKELNSSFSERFNGLATTILNNQTHALTNLSARMEAEISQVWRQIGIMYRELSQSAGTLDRLQSQTESYVNGSLTTMDNMSGKVGQLSSRMGEVDDNLNYLLGRLSLVTQEFNMIKAGLGEALDQARHDFVTLQESLQLAATDAAAKRPIHGPLDDNRVLTGDEYARE